MIACRNMEVGGVKCRGRSRCRKTCGECVRKDMESLDLEPELEIFIKVRRRIFNYR